ncbi:hypothetical protein [Geminicoccus roseus]|uniref:hypothetical protein n=1 Tax=Geminicoccus roseus TaxID=404900 RepID=UPI00040357A2|nr:hypothetical protein [Geminicoccus roseus]
MKRLWLYYSAVRALLIGVIATGSAGQAHAQEASIELSPEDTFWLDVKAADTLEGYQNYLQAYPVGRFASEAFRRLVEQSRLGRLPSGDAPPEPAAGPGLAGMLATADLY